MQISALSSGWIFQRTCWDGKGPLSKQCHTSQLKWILKEEPRKEVFLKSLKLCICLSWRRSWLSKNSWQWQRRFYAAVFMLSFQKRGAQKKKKSVESIISHTCHLFLLYIRFLFLVLSIYYMQTVQMFLAYPLILRSSKELVHYRQRDRLTDRKTDKYIDTWIDTNIHR